MKTQVIGLDKFRTGLAVALSDGRKDLTNDLRTIAAEMVNALQLACPSDSGALKASIKSVEHARKTGPSVQIFVGNASTYYAAFVEYGTSHAPARPFVRPVVARFREKFPGLIAQSIEQTWSGK